MQRRGRISRFVLVSSGHIICSAAPHVTQMGRIMWRAYMLFEDREKNENTMDITGSLVAECEKNSLPSPLHIFDKRPLPEMHLGQTLVITGPEASL